MSHLRGFSRSVFSSAKSAGSLGHYILSQSEFVERLVATVRVVSHDCEDVLVRIVREC